MAQLNNLLVNGNSRFVGDALHTGAVDVSVLRVPSASGATVRTVGTSGQVLKSNGTSVYWGSDNNANYYHKTGTWSALTYTAAKVGSPEDLAFTIPTGTTASTVAIGNHTHTLTIATDSGTNQLTLAHNTKYKITAGGSSYIFTTPTDSQGVTSVTIKGTSPIVCDNETAITSTGTRTLSHANSGVTSGTYGTIATTALEPGYGGTFNVPAFTVDATGHVTSAGNHTVKIPASDNTNYYHKTGTWSALTYTAGKVGSPDDLAFTIPTGTSGTTVAVGNHTHSYAGSSAAGGSANSAVKLDSNAGSATNPVYFSGGKPVSCTYSLNKTVPSDAVFTDTNYYHKTGSWSGFTYTAGKVGSPDDLAFTIPTGTTASTVAVGNHTHTTTIATSSGTNQITLAHSTKYAITAGGTSYVFTTPSDTNTDTKVSQTVTTTSANYEVLFSETADNTTRTEGARKNNNLLFNPNTNSLTVGNAGAHLTYNANTQSLDFSFG